MSDYDVDANCIDHDTLVSKMKSDEYIQCEHCHSYFVWQNIPEEFIKAYYEMHGFKYGPGEYIVEGFTCPSCGKYNGF